VLDTFGERKGASLVVAWGAAGSSIISNSQSFVIHCANMQVPRVATRYIFDLDGIRVDTRINRADHGPFAEGPATATLATLTSDGRRHDLEFAELELTGAFI
jgi:hypothetical protein